LKLNRKTKNRFEKLAEILKKFFIKYKLIFACAAAFLSSFTIYILTLEPKLVGGDTSWFAFQVPRMEVLAPTGYPSFSILGKLVTYIPIKDLAYRLNLLSAIFSKNNLKFY